MKAKTVLVIDDEWLVCWSIAQILRAADYAVAVAETAAEGTRLSDELSPEVIFLDVRLPDADGLELLKKIKSERGNSTAVVVMSAFADIYTCDDVLRLGAYAYLKKPFDFDKLDVLVGEALAAVDAGSA